MAFDYQLNALIYFTAKGNGTMLIGIDDTESRVQAFDLLNSNDLPYGPLQITGIVLEFCGKYGNYIIYSPSHFYKKFDIFVYDLS